MGCPEADGGDGQEDVLTWVEGPGAGEVEGYAEGVAGEGFDCGVCMWATGEGEVTVEEGEEAEAALDDPDRDYGFDEILGRAGVEMQPETGEDEGDEGDVDVEEGFVEGVTEGGERG